MMFETNPTDDQKHRLRDWLIELAIISQKYGIHWSETDLGLIIRDQLTGTIIGSGLELFTAIKDGVDRIIAIEISDSILDGVWLVDGPDGPVEQRADRSVFPTMRFPFEENT